MKKILFPIMLAAIMISSCTRNDNGAGRLVVKVTDDPFNISFVESAVVKISRIELRKSGENEENPFIVISEDTLSFDLLQLRNGVTEELVNLDIPQGSYDLIRLYVEEASLKLKDQPDAFNVKVPSGSQTGIKVFITPGLRVEGGLSSELLLDFDLSKSFVMRGHMEHSSGVTGFIFKPCIRAANLSTTGRITGFVADTTDAFIPDAKVWIEQDSVVATAYTDTDGHYAFIGVPSGTFSMYATKENYDTSKFEDINVISGNNTIQNFILIKKE